MKDFILAKRNFVRDDDDVILRKSSKKLSRI